MPNDLISSPAVRASAPLASSAAPAGGVSPLVIECSDPATGESLGSVPVVPPSEIGSRVARARAAARVWSGTPFAERRRVLRALLSRILQESDAICTACSRDAGKTRENAMFGEVWPVCEKIRYTLRHGEDDLAPQPMSSGILVHKKAHVEYAPLGVIGVITPWNFPFQNIYGPTIASLFAGNATIVKVSEWTSWSAPYFERLFHEVLRACGYPTDLVQVICGFGDTGAALVSGGVDKIVFTGSMHNGRKVLETSAKTLTPVILELGGKDPMIVCDDAAIDQAVHAALAGTLISSGQMCLAAERIYVFERIHDEFVRRLVEVAASLRQGPPLAGEVVDVGAMTMPGQLDIVQSLVDDAVAKGARVEVGGGRPVGLRGQFFGPTVLTGVDHSMRIVSEETFGPVMVVVKVRSEEEAIRLANDTAYGLGSTVFTRDPVRARRIAEKLRAGSTTVNDFGLAYMAQALPFGGVGGSGFGRLNGREGLRACTNAKAVLEDRFPVHRPVKLFPVQNTDYDLAKGAIRLIYGSGIQERLAGLSDLGRALRGRVQRS